MYTNSIFIFGSERDCALKKDAITSLPLELSWKIFSYLDGASLRSAAKVISTWKWIISGNKKLMKRLNMFELGVRLGSHKLARFYKDNKRKVKYNIKSQKYLPIPQYTAGNTVPGKKIYRLKREDDESVIVRSDVY